MVLVICEKPSQARDIARNLQVTTREDGYLKSSDYQVTWCVGHLLALAPPEHYQPDLRPWRMEKLPVVPKAWQKIVLPKTKKQFDIIAQLLKQTKHVLIASDPDREGESIVREILEACHFQGKIERLWLSALDDASIQKAFKNILPGEKTAKLYLAATARTRSDYLIGMNMTMVASALYGVNQVLSIGRVQTPTLKLVVDRDLAIENFKAQDYFELKALFAGENHPAFWTTWQAPKTVLDAQGHCLDQSVVAAIAAKIDGEIGTVSAFSETPKTQSAPPCFSLSALQKKASELFGYTAKQVLDIAQALYEKHKAITYPRTDCAYLPEDQFCEAKAVLQALVIVDPSIEALFSGVNAAFRSSVWNNKKITAHHAMIPTMNEAVELNKMPAEAFNLYDLIRRQYIAQFMSHYEYLVRVVEIQCAGEIFQATHHRCVKLGFKQVFRLSDEDQDIPGLDENEKLPVLPIGQTLIAEKIQIDNKQTKPPARFSEGTLIEAMKTVGQLVEKPSLKKFLKDSHGIGTEATRANILETLFKRGYLARQSKQVLSTARGRALIDLVPGLIKNPQLTAEWEQALEGIVEGQVTLDDFVASQENLLREMLAQLQSASNKQKVATLQLQSDTQNDKVYLCPSCEAPLKRLKNKKSKYFWGCSRYPDCAFTTWERNNKPKL